MRQIWFALGPCLTYFSAPLTSKETRPGLASWQQGLASLGLALVRPRGWQTPKRRESRLQGSSGRATAPPSHHACLQLCNCGRSNCANCANCGRLGQGLNSPYGPSLSLKHSASPCLERQLPHPSPFWGKDLHGAVKASESDHRGPPLTGHMREATARGQRRGKEGSRARIQRGRERKQHTLRLTVPAAWLLSNWPEIFAVPGGAGHLQKHSAFIAVLKCRLLQMRALRQTGERKQLRADSGRSNVCSLPDLGPPPRTPSALASQGQKESGRPWCVRDRMMK